MMSDQVDLHLVQNATFRLTFSDGVTDFRNYDVKAQIRQKESITSLLLLDLSPYFIPSADGTSLVLSVPGPIMAAVDASKFAAVGATKPPAKWDMFLVDKADPTNVELYLQGSAYCDPASTAMVEVTT